MAIGSYELVHQGVRLFRKLVEIIFSDPKGEMRKESITEWVEERQRFGHFLNKLASNDRCALSFSNTPSHLMT